MGGEAASGLAVARTARALDPKPYVLGACSGPSLRSTDMWGRGSHREAFEDCYRRRANGLRRSYSLT